MEQTIDFPVSLDSILGDAQKKNEAIASISNDADLALSKPFATYGEGQKRILEKAERELGECTNALTICTRKAVQDLDEVLTKRLHDFYVLMDEGAKL